MVFRRIIVIGTFRDGDIRGSGANDVLSYFVKNLAQLVKGGLPVSLKLY